MCDSLINNMGEQPVLKKSKANSTASVPTENESVVNAIMLYSWVWS